MLPLLPPVCLAAATIRMEADAEPYLGKLAVATVIRERMRLKYSSDGTVAGTVLRPLQFSGWNTADPNRIRVCQAMMEDPATQEALRAWKESATVPPDFLHGAVLYHATPVILAHLGLAVPRWAHMASFIQQIGNHLFYRDDSHAHTAQMMAVPAPPPPAPISPTLGQRIFGRGK